jgi:hypothetical protein
MAKQTRDFVVRRYTESYALIHRSWSQMLDVRRMSSSLATNMALLREAAPVYRHACPEPPGSDTHLPSKLLHSEVVLRHASVMDILISACTCQPMLFRYDVTYLPELSVHVEDVGFRWMHGIPNQFIVMLARMNMLRKDFAPHVTRLMVQESWRQTMYIYLYMVSSWYLSQVVRTRMIRTSKSAENIRQAPGRNETWAHCRYFPIGTNGHCEPSRLLLLSLILRT